MRRRWREESGEATTEMVLIVPVLLLLLLVVVQFGLWYHAQHVVQAAAQEARGPRASRARPQMTDHGEPSCSSLDPVVMWSTTPLCWPTVRTPRSGSRSRAERSRSSPGFI